MARIFPSWRAIKVAGTAAFDLAKMRGESTKTKARRYIITTLQELGGPGLSAKALQLFGHFPSQGQDKSLYLCEDEVDFIIEREAPDLALNLKELTYNVAQGSLGCVHRGLLKDGRLLAIKTSYPNIRATVLQELDILLKGTNFIAKIKSLSYSYDSYRAFFEKMLLNELDYKNEIKNQEEFKGIYEHSLLKAYVPKPMREFSSESVLTSEWVEHYPLSLMLNKPESERILVGNTLLDIFLEQIFSLKKIQGDFHSGNVGLNPALPGAVILYDFGAILELQPKHVQILSEVITCFRTVQKFDATEAFVELGFNKDMLKGLEGSLYELWRLFSEPFWIGKDFVPTTWDFAKRSADILGPARLLFRMAGPPWFLMFMRTYAGFISLLNGISLDWGKAFCRYSTKRNFSPLSDKKSQATKQAQNLHVRMSEYGEEKVRVAMPLASVDILEDLIPENAFSEIHALGYDIAVLKERAKASGLIPQMLISCEIKNKKIDIWLE